MVSKQFIAIIIVVILGLFGVFTLTKKSNNNSSGSSNSTTQPSEHKEGAGKKGVTLVEYGDYECPYCKNYYPLVKQVQQAYGDQITFQFRNYPLTQLHPHAYEAARAAEAAGKQGKYFPMHDLLYENQDSWANASDVSSIFAGFAQQLGLNVDQFKADEASEAVANIINADTQAGQQLGITGTPTFVLDGKKIDSPSDLNGFKQVIDAEIAAKNNNK